MTFAEEGLEAYTPSFSADLVKSRLLDEFLRVLNGIPSTKALVLTTEVSLLLNLITTHNVLRDHAVQRLLDLNPDISPDVNCKGLCFLLRSSDLDSVKTTASLIRKVQYARSIRDEQPPDFNVIVFPSINSSVISILEKEDILPSVKLHSLNCSLFPLEDDVLSLEFSSTSGFQELILNKDSNVMNELAQAVMDFQSIHGIIPKIIGKGDNAMNLAKLLFRLRRTKIANQSMIVPSNSGAELLELNNINSLSQASNDTNAKNTPTDTISENNLDEKTTNSLNNFSNQFDSIIIIDRDIDLLTPFLSQLTYEGLVDDYFEVETGTLSTEPDKKTGGVIPLRRSESQQSSRTSFGNASTNKELKKMYLNNNDRLFKHIRNLNFVSVGGILREEAKRISNDYEERRNATTIGELNRFVSRLGGLQSDHQYLQFHIALSTELMRITGTKLFNITLGIQQNLIAGMHSKENIQQLTNFLYRCDTEISTVLSLFCIYSIVSNGIPLKLYNIMKKEILQNFGYHHILTLENLRKSQLLSPISTSSSKPLNEISYSAIRKAFNTVVDDVNDADPSDTSYVYSGYSPLTVRLIEAISKTDNNTDEATLAKYTAKGLKTGSEYIAATISLAKSGINKVSLSTPKIEDGGKSVSSEGLNKESKQDDLFNLEDESEEYDTFGIESNLEEKYISGKILSQAPSFKNCKDKVDSIKGSSFEFIQPDYSKLLKINGLTSNNNSIIENSSPSISNKYDIKRSLVVFLGGCTCTEINALRFLSYKKTKELNGMLESLNSNEIKPFVREYVTLTTGLINSKKVIKSMTENINFTDMLLPSH